MRPLFSGFFNKLPGSGKPQHLGVTGKAPQKCLRRPGRVVIQRSQTVVSLSLHFIARNASQLLRRNHLQTGADPRQVSLPDKGMGAGDDHL
jgi:hypothetical protein